MHTPFWMWYKNIWQCMRSCDIVGAWTVTGTIRDQNNFQHFAMFLMSTSLKPWLHTSQHTLDYYLSLSGSISVLYNTGYPLELLAIGEKPCLRRWLIWGHSHYQCKKSSLGKWNVPLILAHCLVAEKWTATLSHPISVVENIAVTEEAKLSHPVWSIE